jgi:DNA-binding transcriptional LysR family regulator
MDHRYRKFLAVAETGSFSAAAKKLHVTQPAITIAVTSLELSLGVKLYVRRKAPIQLTPEGQIVAESARVIEKEVEKMRSNLHHEYSSPSQRVGLIDSIAHLLYSSPSERLLLSSVEVMVDNSKRILRDLTSGSIEVGVITGQLMPLGPDINVRKLHNEEFVFVAQAQKIEAGSAKRIDDWLATNQDSTSYQHFTKLFLQKDLSVTPIFYSSSMELLRDMALAGKGTALLPRHIVQRAINDGSLEVVKTKPLYRPIWAVSRRDTAATLMKLFASHISSLLEKAEVRA